ncbi:MAG: VWA domain-containing protein, partial [Spirochaetaceae bacterium]
QYSTADHQVIIFITDGDNNAGEVAPHTAAGLLQKAGIKLYTIGIGGDEAAPIEFVYPDTGTAFRGTMADSYDIELLQSIADTSGGQLYTAESMGTLAAIMREIDSLELVESRVRVAVASYPLYRYFLVAALLLLLVDFIIRTIVLREVL